MITDPSISPFNIGTYIALNDFGLEEVQSLVSNLGPAANNGELAGYLYERTGGQPYLCQRLCQYLTESSEDLSSAAVDAAIDRFFREDRVHLPAILRNFEGKPDLVKHLCRVLVKRPRLTPATNRVHFQLAHVIGIIAADQPVCQVRNPIYQRALDEAGLCEFSDTIQPNLGVPLSLPSPATPDHRPHLRYLHISDLHLIGQPKDKDGWEVEQFNQYLVTHSMLDVIEALVQREGKALDLIFITGDLAKRGKREDYLAVEAFCRRLLKVTSVPAKRLFIVPGNHDVDRGKIKDLHIRRLYSFGNQEEITEVLGDPDLFPVLMRKFAEFSDFAFRALGRQLYTDRDYCFTETTTIQKSGKRIRINIVGLNSALFAGYDGDDQRKLAFGLLQMEAALQKSIKEQHLTIALSHHPFSCFHQADEVCRNRLMKGADLVLTGHLHEPENMFVRNSAGQAVLIGAGASFDKRESENSFNVAEIDLETGKGEVQFYKYLPKDHRWKANTDANPDHERGLFEFTIEKIARQARQSSAGGMSIR